MRLLQEQPDMSQRDLADKVGISLGALNYCLKALMDKGFVKLDNFQQSKHKLKYAYILTPAGIAQKMAMTGRFLMAAMQALSAHPQGQDVRLLLLGDGARKAHLQAKATELGLDGTVRFVDTVPKAEVARYWSVLDASIIHLQRSTFQ